MALHSVEGVTKPSSPKCCLRFSLQGSGLEQEGVFFTRPRIRIVSKIPLLLMLLSSAADAQDADGDGLSDFQEREKYRTTWNKADSDGDGKPDGDWDGRREYTYTIRTVVRVMPPIAPDFINDDYQDARIRKQTKEYVELEVIHYPFSAPGTTLEPNPTWRSDYADMKQHLDPGITTNWDETMRRDLIAALRSDGIDVEQLDDKRTVEQVSNWIMANLKCNDLSTVSHLHYPDGIPTIFPGLEKSFERGKGDPSWTMQQQFEHELYGRSMFYNRTRGTCTPSATAITTILRALGIPTRMIIVIPAVDASNAKQVAKVADEIKRDDVRAIILEGLERLGNSNASHTFNEVYVGNRWHRLNYNHLDQGILDSAWLGLMTHVHTFGDLSEANLAPTWTVRAASGRRDDAFGGNNPYTTIAISDQTGKHSNPADLPSLGEREHQRLTISKVYWFHSGDRPAMIPADWRKQNGEGHLLIHVDEAFQGSLAGQYESFFADVDKQFELIAEGHPTVKAVALQAWWVDHDKGVREFYLNIPAGEFEKMKPGVAYSLRPRNQSTKCRWEVARGVHVEATNR